MRITVQWTPHRQGLPDEQEVELGPKRCTVAELLQQLEEPQEGILAVRGDVPVPLDTALVDGERILLVRTVSGG